MSKRFLIVGLVLALAGAACAPRRPPAVPGAAAYPDLLFPGVPSDLQAADMRATAGHQDAWTWLQSGNTAEASRSFATVLEESPNFYPSVVGLGYIAMVEGDYDQAIDRFDAALGFNPTYVPALVGRGESLLQADRWRDALTAFESALRADPTLTAVARRIEVLRFRGMEEDLAEARRLESGGDLAGAREAYRRAVAASPESGFLYREVASLSLRLGDVSAALAEVEEALARDPSDTEALLLLAEARERQGDLPGAVEALTRARDSDSALDLAARLESLNERILMSRLPPEYREIDASGAVNRRQLAALLGVRLEPLLSRAPTRANVLITDVRDDWAESWILGVARAGVMDVYANHTFQPSRAVQRSDMAVAVSRVLELIGEASPAMATRWSADRTFPDLPAGHLQHDAAAIAVDAGVMEVAGTGAFEGFRDVSGADAVRVVDRLAALASRAVGATRP